MAKKGQSTILSDNAQLDKQTIEDSDSRKAVGGDLEQLRDILFGNQARSTEERLNRLERSLDTSRQELNDLFTERLNWLRESSSEELAKLHSKIVDQLNRQDEKQAGLLRQTQSDLDTKHDQQAAGLASVKKEFVASLEQLSTDFNQQLNQTQKELGEQLERLGADIRNRLQANQEESRQRDADLRQEFLALGSWLDDKKASRHDLGQMLIDVGHSLRHEQTSSMENSENEQSR